MNSKTTFLLSMVLWLSLPLCAVQAQTAQYPSLTRTRKPFVDRQRKIAPIQVSPRLLVTVGDTLYMLNDKRQIMWKWDAGNGEDIMDQPFVDSHGNIFLIADDGLMFSLDVNGKVRWRHRLMGASFYTQLKPYGKDQYLVVQDNSSYREDRGFNESDTIFLCRDEDTLAEADFLSHASLRVKGRRIFAVIKHGWGVRVKEIKLRRMK